MKKLSVLSLMLLVIAGITSCGKIVDKVFPGVDAKVPDIQLTIRIVPVVFSNEFSLGSFTTRINLDSTIRANTAGVFGIGIVSSIKVKEIVINLPNADNLNNLANFETARVTFTAPNNSAPLTVAALNFPDTYAATSTHTPTDSPELLDYLKGSEVTYTVYGRARRTTTKALNMTVSVTVRVK